MECVRNCAILSICEGRPGSLVIQYFSFLVQFGVAILTAVSPPAPSLLYDCVRDMETTLSAFGRRPWLWPLRWRDFEVCDPARGICGASWLNDVEFSISPPRLLGGVWVSYCRRGGFLSLIAFDGQLVLWKLLSAVAVVICKDVSAHDK